MSETPRTDRMVASWPLESFGEMTGLARQLERENAALREQLEGLKRIERECERLARSDAMQSEVRHKVEMENAALREQLASLKAPVGVEGVIALCRRSLDRDVSTLTSEQALASQCLSALESLAAQLAERDAEIAALKGHAVEPRIGLNSDGSLDEVVGSPGHIEQLDSGHWFVEIGEYAIWLHAKGKIVAHYEHRAAYPKEADKP